MKRISLLYLVRTHALGGSSTIVLSLANNLPTDRFNLVIASYDASGDGDIQFIEALRSQGKDIIDEKVPWRSRYEFFKALEQIQRLIQRYHIDLVHTHDTLSNTLVGLARNCFSCACLASAYGWWEPKRHIKRRLYYFLERRFALPRFDRIYTVSQDMQEKIVGAGTPGNLVRVIHTGVDTKQFFFRGKNLPLRSALGIPPNGIVVGTVARLSPEKGHSLLFESAKVLIDEFPNLYFVIVGTGPHLNSLKKQIEKLKIVNRVIFTGFYQNVSEIYGVMDIFTLPSVLQEGFPTVSLEAQASGLPVVISDIGGSRETIVPNETGLLVQPGNVRSLVEALKGLLSNEKGRHQMSKRAMRLVEEKFSQNSMISQMIDLYQETWTAWTSRNRS